MEAPELFHAGFCLAGTPHCSPEKTSGGGEPLVVEDLLDFSNEEAGWMIAAAGEVGAESDGAAGNSTYSSTVTVVDSYCNSSLSACDHKDTVCRSAVYASLSGDFCEPRQYDAMAELTKLEHEWALSDVVDDSFSREELHKLRLINGVNSMAASSSATTIVAATTFLQDGQISTFRPDVPGKARSKRSRVAPGNWSSRLLVLPPSEVDAPSPDSELIVPLSTGAPKKVTKKKEPSESAAASDGRQCLHCQTDKTPQWRTGPMGPKTLCNACGVRFKSGRLVPEYRPAASPTFVVSQHSNSHRKVLELRRQKEFQQQLTSPATALYDPPQAVLPSGFLIPGPDIRHLI